MPARRLAFAFALAAAFLAVASPRRASSDAASAEAALPAGREPFLLVTTTTTTASKFDDLARRPEYAVYANGTFLVQKSDGRLWGTTLSHAEVVEFMRFVLEEAAFPSIDMRYLLSSPLTTFTQFTLTTRSGSYSARKRASGGYGPGVKDGEKALGSVETKLIAIADRAQAVYTPDALFVVARRISPGDAIPSWAANGILPFATLIDSTDVETKSGAVFEGARADAIRSALAMGPSWRFGIVGAELRARPALPHEWSPAAQTPTAGAELPKPPPMAVPSAPPPPAPLPSAPSAPTPLPTPPPAPAPLPTAPPPPAPLPAPPPAPTPLPTAPPEPTPFPAPPPAPTPLPTAPPEPTPLPTPAPAPTPLPTAPPEPTPLPTPPPAPAPIPAPTTPAPEPTPTVPAEPTPLPVPAPSPTPAPAPTPPPPPTPNPNPAGPASGTSDWNSDDVDFAGVQKIFVDFNRKTTGSPHGKFWTKTYEEFYAFEVDSTEGKIRLIEPGNGTNSNMIRGLMGRPMIVRKDDGTFKEHDFGRMPGKGTGMPPEQIERLRRWIDHGAPRERPGAGSTPGTVDPAPNGTTPSSATQPVKPGATATGEARELTLVGSDSARLGKEGPEDDATLPPKVYVAKSAAEWAAIFDTTLAADGANGPRVAKALMILRDLAKGYDFTTATLVLLVGPVSDHYAVEGTPTLEVLSDGSGRLVVAHQHDTRRFARVPDYVVWWAVYRVTGACPAKLSPVSATK